MTSPEVDLITSCTRDLTHSIASGEHKLEEMIRRGSAILGKGQCIRDFQLFIDSMNSVTKNGQRRAVLLEELQRENKLIMAYQEENRILKDAVEDCFNTLDTVMAKHKVAMHRVQSIGSSSASLDEIWNLLFNDNDAADKEKLRTIVNGLTSHISKGEEENHLYMERVSQLRQEHAVLREMLATSEISNPGVGKLFARILKEIRRRKASTSMLDMSEDEGLNNTIIEVNPALNNTVIEVKPNPT